MEKSLKYKKAAAFIMVCVLLVVNTIPFYADARAVTRSVKVGFYEMNGYQNVDSDGVLSGYAFDYMQALAQYSSWDIEYVTKYNWSECLSALENGEIDLLCGAVKTKEREKTFDFSELSAGIAYSYLTVNPARTDICFEDYEAFNGMTVGLAKNSARNDDFLRYSDKNGFSVNIAIYDTENQLTQALKKNEVDAIMTTSNLEIDGMRVVAKFNPQPQYIATTKGNTGLLNELNEAMTRLKTDIPNFDDRLYSSYYGPFRGESVVFTKEELEYIKQHQKIKVMYDPAWAPIEATKDGKAHGIAIDVMNSISAICGIEVEYTAGTTFNESLSLFNEGNAAVFTAITYDYSWAEQNNMLLTQPYLDIPLVSIYKNENVSIKKLALPTGYYITQFIKAQADSPEIIYYDTVGQCIEAVNRGSADATYANMYEADYYLAMPAYRHLNFHTIQSTSQRLSVAVSKNADPLLFSIINKSIQGLTSADISESIRIHTEHTVELGFMDMVYTNPVQFFAIICIVMVLLITLGVMLAFYITNKKKHDALQKALAAKSEFLSNMSHDMRTPMNGILGLLDLTLDMPDIPKDVRTNLYGIQDSCKYLLSLINDTLDMSKIENNKLTLHYETVDTAKLVQNILSYVSTYANENGVELTVDAKNAELEYVKTDPLRLQQIFVNIVSNAVKFTPRGGKVEMVIECLKRENGIAYDRISVKDNGIGMSEEFLPKIFEPFEQEKAAGRENIAGTGLGMSIVKHLVEMMHGKIEITSKKNVGTEVVVFINFERVYPDKKEELSSEKNCLEFLHGKRLLLVEDHPLNATIATKLLEKKGMAVEQAVNGKLAVERFANSSSGYYDAILMDIRMPVMNGLEASKTIRALNRDDAKTVPIIAMTANAFDDDVEKSIAAGMNAHLAKPIETQKLYDTLFGLLKGSDLK